MICRKCGASFLKESLECANCKISLKPQSKIQTSSVQGYEFAHISTGLGIFAWALVGFTLLTRGGDGIGWLALFMLAIPAAFAGLVLGAITFKNKGSRAKLGLILNGMLVGSVVVQWLGGMIFYSIKR